MEHSLVFLFLHSHQRVFFKKICQVGGLTITHKRSEPHLARGQTIKQNFNKHFYIVLATNSNSLSKDSDM